MLIRKLIYASLSVLIPFQTLYINALEKQLLDYRQISQSQCRQAIQSVEKQLRDYKLKITTNRFEVDQPGYDGPPAGITVAFWMDGNETESILESYKLMLALSTRIINSCTEDKVVAVDFAKQYSGWVIRFGLIRGVIKEFEIEEPPGCGVVWGTICNT